MLHSTYTLVVGSEKQTKLIAAILRQANISFQTASNRTDALSLTKVGRPAGVIFTEALVQNEPFWEILAQIREYVPEAFSFVVKEEDEIEIQTVAAGEQPHGEVHGNRVTVFIQPSTGHNPLFGTNGVDGSPDMYFIRSSTYLDKELPAFIQRIMS
jgi:hypothetical protein